MSAMFQTSMHPVITGILKFIVFLGSYGVFFLSVVIIYWCISKRKGQIIGIIILAGSWLNMIIENLFLNSQIYISGNLSLFPSIPQNMLWLFQGQIYISLVFFIMTAYLTKKKWIYIIAAILCPVLNFSYITIGSYQIRDICIQWALAAVILCIYFIAEKKILPLFEKASHRIRMISAALFAFLMILYRPNAEFIIPGALFLGYTTGFLLFRRYSQFDNTFYSSEKLSVKNLYMVSRVIMGLAVLAVIHISFIKIIQIIQVFSFYIIFRYFQFALIGIWVSFGAPWLFGILHLSPVQIKEKRKDE